MQLLQSVLWVLAVMIVSVGICPPMADETFFKLMREAKEKKKKRQFIHRDKSFKIFLYVKEKTKQLCYPKKVSQKFIY